MTHINKTEDHRSARDDPRQTLDLLDLDALDGTEPDPFGQAWAAHVAAHELASPLDTKARAFALFYFGIPRSVRSVTLAASSLGIERKTASARLRRCEALGWLTMAAPPLMARKATLPRVYTRKVFWSADPWSDALRLPTVETAAHSAVA